ncbi:MAG: hypothetical protein V7739_11695 [Motiliproteus sp.]
MSLSESFADEWFTVKVWLKSAGVISCEECVNNSGVLLRESTVSGKF